MNLELTLISQLISLVLALIGWLPTLRRWYQLRNINPRLHTIFGTFNLTEQHIVSVEYYAKNELRKEAIQKWHREANKHLLAFCQEISQESFYDLSEPLFKARTLDRATYYMESFRQYVFNIDHFAPIVRDKFAIYTIDLGLFRIVLDIKGYLTSPNLTNKQRVWYMLTDIEKYLHNVPSVMQKQNNLNGDLDLFEQLVLENKKPY